MKDENELDLLFGEWWTRFYPVPEILRLPDPYDNFEQVVRSAFKEGFTLGLDYNTVKT